jgi:hypothetical protein
MLGQIIFIAPTCQLVLCAENFKVCCLKLSENNLVGVFKEVSDEVQYCSRDSFKLYQMLT